MLAVFGVLVVGVGAAWAASGINPVTSLFGQDVKVVNSDYGIDSFSILGSANQESLDALPKQSVQMLGAVSTMSQMSQAAATARENGRDLPSNFKPTPPEISAIGRGQASTGSKATVLVMNGQICTIWESRSGTSGCDSLESIRKGFTVGGSPEMSNRGLWRIHGIVTDQVASLKIEGSDTPLISVPDNVFELRNMKPKNIRLIGLDQDGNRVLEMGAPIASWAGGGD